MRSLPPDIEELLDAERDAPDPSPATRARVKKKIEISVGLAVATTAVAATTKAAAAGKAAGAVAGTSLAAKIVIGAAVSASLLGGGVYLTQKKTPVVAPAPHEELGERTTREPRRAPIPTVTVPSLPPPAPPKRPIHPSSLSLEQALLEDARAALGAGATGRALLLVQQHERQFPAGQLGEARDSLRIAALVADGHHASATARAAEFRRRYPHSLFQPAVDASLSH